MTRNNPINKRTASLEVNESYNLPTSDGTSNQVMITDGAGTLSFNDYYASGNVVQQVYSSTGAYIACSTAMPIDDTIPQNTEGDEVLTVNITPASASNLLFIEFSCSGVISANKLALFALFQDSTTNALAAGRALSVSVLASYNVVLRHQMLAGTTSATTFKIRSGEPTGSTVYINGYSGNRNFGGVSATNLTVTEIKV